MKTVNTKQRGFFDPVIGMALLSIFGLIGVAVHPANPADATETQHQVACAETRTTIVGEDFHCN